VTDTATLQLDAKADSPPIRAVDLYLDDVYFGRKELSESIPFQSQKISNGYHELRLVAIADDQAGATSSEIIPLVVRNRNPRISARCAKTKVAVGQPVLMEVECTSEGRISAVHNGREVAQTAGKEVSLRIDSKQIGRGPSRIFCTWRDAEGRLQIAEPISVEITGPLADKPIQLGTQKPPKKK
jgi:hypothetical protein